MKSVLDDSKPIFIQVAKTISDSILNETIKEGEQVPSTNQFASHYQINPATAAKGINQLVDEGILFKKRGVGMFVADGAREKLLRKHQQSFYDEFVTPLLQEAKKLGLANEDIIQMLKQGEKK